MIYVDTSVLVALFVNETRSQDVSKWYSSERKQLVSSFWCVTEFSSALAMKLRALQITKLQAHEAWRQFERLCENDLNLIQITSAIFFDAAQLTLESDSQLRAGDAIHLAAALNMKAKSMATLDKILAKNSKVAKMKLIF